MSNSTLLSQQQSDFVEFRLQGMSGSEAARRAGYGSPGQAAYRLMRSKKILQALELRGEKDAFVAGKNKIRQYWTEVMMDPEADTKDRLRASELLAKSTGIFVDRKEITGKAGGPLQFGTWVDLLRDANSDNPSALEDSTDIERFN